MTDGAVRFVLPAVVLHLMRFRDRDRAGRVLAERLRSYAPRENLIGLGLPRGGVPVVFEVAGELDAPLDVFVVHKLGERWTTSPRSPATVRPATGSSTISHAEYRAE